MRRCASSWTRSSVCVVAFSVITMATGTIFVLHRAVRDSYSVQKVCPYFHTALKQNKTSPLSGVPYLGLHSFIIFTCYFNMHIEASSVTERNVYCQS